MNQTVQYAIMFFGFAFAYIAWNEIVILPFQLLDPRTVALMTDQEYNERTWLNLPCTGISFLFMAGGAYSAIGLYESTLTPEVKELEYRHLVLGFKALPSSLKLMKGVAEMMAAEFVGWKDEKLKGGRKNG